MKLFCAKQTNDDDDVAVAVAVAVAVTVDASVGSKVHEKLQNTRPCEVSIPL